MKKHALHIIDLFGGIRPMSAKTGIPISTINSWKIPGTIPVKYHHDILECARAHKIRMTAEDFFKERAAQ